MNRDQDYYSDYVCDWDAINSPPSPEDDFII